MDESRFARFYEHKDLDRELQMSHAEVGRKDGFFYNFVENLINKKLYDRSCILWYMVTCDVFKVLKFSILRTWKTSLVPIYHEMQSCSYDFLYQVLHKSNRVMEWIWVYAAEGAKPTTNLLRDEVK